MEELLGTEIGKHDYDWLLTPPGTPRAPKLEVAEKAPSSNVPKRTINRSASTTRASRPSFHEAENGHSTIPNRPARSYSRPSIQSALMSSNNRPSVLTTSNSSISSRPTTPTKRTSIVPPSKPSAPASRVVTARSSTPAKTRPPSPAKTRPSTPVKSCSYGSNSMANSTGAKSTSAQNSRSSTPTSRPRMVSSSSSSTAPPVSRPSSSSGRIPAICRTSSSSSTASVSRSSSWSSTPTRQPVMRPSAPPIGRSPSVGRISSSSNLTSSGRSVASRGRMSAPSSAPSSRPSSPNSRPRAPVRPLDILDFPSDTPPNLRTKLPERPLSAGRARPGVGLGARSTLNAEPVTSAPVKKVSVPAITRSTSKAPSLTNGHQNRQSDRYVIDSQPARPSRSTTSEENGFGRTISRKSLDMAIKHMDIRQNLGGIRGASLFPHSIRSSTAKVRPARMSDPGHHTPNGEHDTYTDNGHFSSDSNGALSHYGGSSTDSPDRESIGTKETMSELDIYGSSRYEEMLLREDTKNTDWLHNVDDKSDQSPVFDHRFEPLPEPFGPL
uniref:Uncharacterized protein n=1 Tax=Avena sativa TaxID=4498 RepID=A0ACD5WKG0_AVESA